MKSFPTFVGEACEIHYFRLHFGEHLVTVCREIFLHLRFAVIFHFTFALPLTANDKISCCDIDFAEPTRNTATSNLPNFQRGVSFLVSFAFFLVGTSCVAPSEMMKMMDWLITCQMPTNQLVLGVLFNYSHLVDLVSAVVSCSRWRQSQTSRWQDKFTNSLFIKQYLLWKTCCSTTHAIHKSLKQTDAGSADAANTNKIDLHVTHG